MVPSLPFPQEHVERISSPPGAAILQKHMDMLPSGNTHLSLVLPFGDEQEDCFLSQRLVPTIKTPWPQTDGKEWAVCAKQKGGMQSWLPEPCQRGGAQGWSSLLGCPGPYAKEGDCGAGLLRAPSFTALWACGSPLRAPGWPGVSSFLWKQEETCLGFSHNPCLSVNWL